MMPLKLSHRGLAVMGLVLAVILLLWPSAGGAPPWDLPGMFGGGNPEAADVALPIDALISGEPVDHGGDRFRVVAGLILLGFSIGAGLGSTRPTRKPAEVSQLPLDAHVGHQP